MREIVAYRRNGKLIPIADENNYKDIYPVYNDSVHGKYVVQHSLILVTEFIVGSSFSSKLNVEHTINGGLYCEVISDLLFSGNDAMNLNEKLQEIIQRDDTINSKYKTKHELLELFIDDETKHSLIQDSEIEGAYYCEFNGVKDFFPTPLVKSTGMLDGAYLRYYPPGIIIYSKKDFEKEDQQKLFNVYIESEKWVKILKWNTIVELNRSINSGDINELIHVSEALHERKIVDIANTIDSRRGRIQLVTIAGPSSSGKTTFLKRLSVQLRVLGLNVAGISLDNYFVNRERTPIDENGEPDFESIEAIDLELFNEHLERITNYEEVEIPEFDFMHGRRKEKGNTVKIDRNTIIIIEGIHGLNERLTQSIPRDKKLKLYVSALTQINLDASHRISTTDNRLIRRIVRDYMFRNHTADQTFDMWKNVRRGEEKNIFPFQEESDFMFNSSLLYELSAMKNFAEPLLNDISVDRPYYMDAQRLLFLLSYFKPVSLEMIPHTSVLREFIGGSSFDY